MHDSALLALGLEFSFPWLCQHVGLPLWDHSQPNHGGHGMQQADSPGQRHLPCSGAPAGQWWGCSCQSTGPDGEEEDPAKEDWGSAVPGEVRQAASRVAPETLASWY